MSQNVATPSKVVTTQKARPAWLHRVMRVEWLGQTAASLCWIASVFAYELSSPGDYLQLCAASAWLVANIAVAVTPRDS